MGHRHISQLLDIDKKKWHVNLQPKYATIDWNLFLWPSHIYLYSQKVSEKLVELKCIIPLSVNHK